MKLLKERQTDNLRYSLYKVYVSIIWWSLSTRYSFHISVS